MQQHTTCISAAIEDIIDSAKTEGEVTLGDFVDRLGDTSFLIVIFMFALINSPPMPLPPGTSLVAGVPIMFLGVQMMMNRKAIWLPQRVRRCTFPQQKIAVVLKKLLPRLKKLERFIRPRMVWMSRAPIKNMLSFIFVIMGLILALPLPFLNALPAIVMCLLSIGLMARDGVFICAALTALLATFGTFVYLLPDIIQALQALFS